MNPALFDHVLVVDHEDVGARLVERDCGLRDRDHHRRLCVLENHAYRHAVGQDVVLVREHRTDDLSVGLRIDRDIDEVDLALLGIDAVVGKLQLNHHKSKV